MTATATNDTWMETCFVTISAIGKQNVEFRSITETMDFDIGEKDIEGTPIASGGRIMKFNPEGDSTVTLEAYPLEVGAGEGFFDMLNGDQVLISRSTTTATTADKLVDTGVSFTSFGIKVGDIIDNLTDSTFAVVTAIDSATVLSISGNIMASGEEYKITRSNVVVSGTTTSTTASKLEDSSENFTRRGVAVGDKVRNTTDNTEAVVTAIDDADTLSLSVDIMATTENYIITQSPQRILNNRIRTKYRLLALWTNDSTVVTAASGTAENASAMRIGMAEGRITSVKPSFTDGVLKFTITYKCGSFDKSGTANVMTESCAGSGGTDKLPAIASYTTTCKFD